MNQITQKELLETIEAKRQSAENAYVRAHISGSRAEVEKNKNYMDAYQDALCYIASVEIVPERIEANKGQFVGGIKIMEQDIETFSYRKKPIVIEAVQLKEDTNTQNNPKWFQEAIDSDRLTLWCGEGKVLFAKIYTLEGDMEARLGDYIIKGVNGELYPCKPDIFEKTYEKVSE